MASAIAYLLQCHQSATRLTDLLARLYTPDDIFLIHCDRKSPVALSRVANGFASRLPNIHMLDSAFISWGGFSQAALVLRACRLALTLPESWEHLVVLSEHHLPLHPPAGIASRLHAGESLIEARHYRDMHPAEQADIRHRFGMLYRELPGVGAFAIAQMTQPEDFFDRLYHASNWFVLARPACDVLAPLGPADPRVAPFTRCLLPDEMLVPTLLLGTGLGRNLRIARRNATFVAHPNLGGLPDLTFTGDNVRTAVSAGFLFIRKQPDILPPGVLDMPAGPHPAFAEAIRSGEDDPIPVVSAEADLPAELMPVLHALGAAFPDLTATRSDPASVPHCPRIYITFTQPVWGDAVRVVLLCEDFSHCKAAVMWCGSGPPDPAPCSVGPFQSTVCKARVHGIAFAREVFLPDETLNGFLAIAGPAETRARLWRDLEHVVARHILAADAFAAALTAR